MTDCVIQADYVNWRTVVGRKTLQLIFEIDISQQGEVLKLLGPPASDKSVPCAIALLDLNKPEGQESEANGSPKKWSELARSQQASILGGDPDFQRYFRCENGLDAANKIRDHFRIKSRKELDIPENHARWDEFVAIYNMKRAK